MTGRGTREAFITRSMLARLTQQLQARRAGGHAAGEDVGIMVNGEQVIDNTADCGIMQHEVSISAEGIRRHVPRSRRF